VNSLFNDLKKQERKSMKKENKSQKTKMVKLLKLVNGSWQIVDYGVPSKASVYAALGYLVEQEMKIKEI
jgi:hypothetical protein